MINIKTDKWILELFANELDTCFKKEFNSEDDAEEWLFDYLERCNVKGMPYGYNIYNKRFTIGYAIQKEYLANELL